MSEISQIKHWHAPTSMGGVYEQLLGAIGTDEFGDTVKDSMQKVTRGVRRLYLFEANGQQENVLQYYSCEPEVVDLFPTYCRWYQHLDPLSDAYLAAPECSDVALQRIYPDDIESIGFRRRFFDDAGIVERVGIVQRGNDAWRGMTVARHAREGRFSDEELDALVGLACLTLPMLPLNRKRGPSAPPLTVDQLEDRFGRRYQQLTRRERQVCARAALGMTVEATARDLGIARTSVLTYRQRAYQRLQVNSPCELCTLVTH
ncbi:MAG: helix-turn-helix transcriptional regulator [Gammaproteobacteria bacterium]|nr:helix-turn-helix transcriptional regulator [Gammaproteobacteria bacterium]